MSSPFSSRWRRLGLELLEDRRLLSAGPLWKDAIIVSTAIDEIDGDVGPGNLSLREALLLAIDQPGDDLIQFDGSLAGRTIRLTLGPLPITSNVEIQGPGDLTVKAGVGSRTFTVPGGVTAGISGLTVTGTLVPFWESSGGISNAGTLTITNSTICHNVARGHGLGGGIHNTGVLTITGATISHNGAFESEGGGIFNEREMTITNATITNNEATFGGGGILNLGVAILHNTIVAGNVDDDFAGDPPVPGSSHNLIGGDPGLGPLQNNGGPMRTHAPLPGSPAVDAGSNDRAADAGLTFDQRGFSRLVDGDGDGWATVDIGAVEFSDFMVVSTSVDEDDGDYGPGDLSLREALALADAQPGRQVIGFDESLAGATIRLDPALGQLEVLSDVDIRGPGELSVSAGAYQRVFAVARHVAAAISGLTITSHAGTWQGDHNGVYSVGNVTLTNCTISGIGSWASGAGIYNEGTMALVGCTVADNTTYESGGGGGIYNTGEMILIDSTISGNDATEPDGGGIFNEGTMTISRSTISDNRADASGGGVCNYGTLTITDSTISGNSAFGDWGGGAGIFSLGTLRVTNTTITANNMDWGKAAGGGIFIEAGLVVLHNTIVAGNDPYDVGGWGELDPASSHNLIGGDPGLGPLADNGGPTLTHALLPGSPAIEAGSNGRASDAGLNVDQRGFARFFDGDGDGSQIVDIGAVEFDVPIVVSTSVDENDGDHSPGDLSLREALALANAYPARQVIRFDESLAGATIQLTLGALSIQGDVDIQGPGDLTVKAAFDDGVFAVAVDVAAAINGLTITTDRWEWEGYHHGVYNAGALTLTDCTISGFIAYLVSGAGIYNVGAMTLVGCTVSDNETLESEGGGGIYSTGEMDIIDSTISGNYSESSEYNGGGILNRGTMTVSRSTISDNVAWDMGGGTVNDGTLTITDSTISRNLGGGVFNLGTLRVTNSTISGYGVEPGWNFSGILNFGRATLYNTIVAGHAPFDVVGELDPASSHNLIGGDPRLGPLADNGGPTLTHALLPDSPAIDAGSNGRAADAGLTRDQRGFLRIINGTVDVGALEFWPGPPAVVTGRHVFYNDSAFDGNDPAADALDDDAVAADKQALMPGQMASFVNYTSYSRGINGVMVDVEDFPPIDGPLDPADCFVFGIGNDDTPDGWQRAPDPAAVTVRPGAGIAGSDRLTILWPDNVVQKQWLQVTVLANSYTHLAEADVFYFGNAIGESGNSTTDAKVDAFDMLAARDNPRTFLDQIPIDFDYDYDRNRRVNATDMLIARDNPTHFLNALKLITVPDGKSAARLGDVSWLSQFDQTGRNDLPSKKDPPARQIADGSALRLYLRR